MPAADGRSEHSMDEGASNNDGASAVDAEVCVMARRPIGTINCVFNCLPQMCMAATWAMCRDPLLSSSLSCCLKLSFSLMPAVECRRPSTVAAIMSTNESSGFKG